MSAPHELHFAVSQNGVEDSGALHDDPSLPQNGQGAPAGGASSGVMGYFSQSAHPFVCLFHVLFKGLALVIYLMGNKLVNKDKPGGDLVTVIVVCVLLLAFDFWTVKNVTGRLLVGLRWWNKVEGETTQWVFESAQNRANNKFDENVFWTVLYATPVVWGVLSIIEIFGLKFSWLIINFMAIGMSGANVYGYYKCSSDQKAKFEQMMQQGAQQGAMHMMRSGLMGFMTGGGGQQTQQQQQQQPQQQQQQFV
mmetsp:Transcript_1958/g.4829  ORF Transcript_1958/g.4829 Transcript_1958/m.4829 type:complete len:251 (+) Transcript_1958:202-954(+)|eukprot:CAMPEP_0119560278 /NCGR_PEP_ID=MMETSP1352-20130426/14478_1 /TAXON_ID=265584 /ORGANISM="Stauroneis constricta, Strain CCMP1120" /LENGTH=250 /DNA_ID=CAMNT_0007608227 /DNA_START=117 /DNA_END=869 /DNA_ORIENTATION=+